MIERTHEVARVYPGFTERHIYRQQTNPQTLKTEYEHLVVRIYDHEAQLKEYNQASTVDKTA
jgi:hypothetical protein